MLIERNKLIVQAHQFLDICLTAASFIGAYFIKKYLLPEPFRGLTETPNYYIILLMVIIIWSIMFNLFDLYSSYRRQNFAQILWNMIKAVSTAMLVMILIMYIINITDVSRIMIGMFFLIDIGVLALSKGLVYKTLSRKQKEFNLLNILIIGYRERAKDVITAIESYLGAVEYRVLGCLDTNADHVGKEISKGVQVIDTVDGLEKILREEVVDEVIFAMPLSEIENVVKYIAIAEGMGVAIRIIPDWYLYKIMYRPEIASVKFEPFLMLPAMLLTSTPSKHEELLIKRTIDYIFASIAMVLLLPLFLAVSCAIKLSSKGPIFFKQERSGINGRKFMVYKFRTMLADAEARRKELEALDETDGPVFKIKKDPRIIPFVGTLLRKTSLDELPQLINVLKGEMSLVGPRPPIPAEVEKYDIWQRRRLSMKPGLTCLWQVTPNRNEIGFDEWMKMDLRYIDNWSIGLDLKILLKTAQAVFMGAGR